MYHATNKQTNKQKKTQQKITKYYVADKMRDHDNIANATAMNSKN